MEHRLEYCKHYAELDPAVDDRFGIIHLNTTVGQYDSLRNINNQIVLEGVVDKYDDTPVANQYLYTQWRDDVNDYKYKVQYFVKDPQNDPLAAMISRDRRTYRGVEEAYTYTYTHNYFDDAYFRLFHAKSYAEWNTTVLAANNENNKAKAENMINVEGYLRKETKVDGWHHYYAVKQYYSRQ